MFNAKLATFALSLEASALATLFTDAPNQQILLWFLLVHAGASACLALFAWALMPAPYQQPRKWALLFLFSFSFFIPIMGLIGLFVGMLVAAYLPRIRHEQSFETVAIPEYVNLSSNVTIRYDAGGIRARLLDQNASLESRLKAMMAIQQMPSRLSSPLLRQMLTDPADDIRLVAYGMLDQREKAINHKITEELANLDSEQSATARQTSLRHLAELYWELVYQGLVQGDVRKHAVGQSMEYVAQSLELTPDEPGLWVLQGKLINELGQISAAGIAFQRAIELGYPAIRLLPYQAEMAFVQRDFQRVRQLLSEMSAFDNSEKTQALVQFWRMPDTTADESHS